MDANTQIANDLHLLTAPIRFLFRCVLRSAVFAARAPDFYGRSPSCAFPLTQTATSRSLRWLTWRWLHSRAPFGCSW